MKCTKCKLPLSPIEVTDAIGMCLRCEVIWRRNHMEREMEDVRKYLQGSTMPISLHGALEDISNSSV